MPTQLLPETLEELRKEGFQSMLTPERLLAVLTVVERDGMREGRAARLAGVLPQTLTEWKSRAPSIAVEIARAQDARLQGLIAQVRSHAPKDWRAAAWLAEREAREDYGEQSKIDLQVQGQLAHVILSAVDLQRIRESHRAAMLGAAMLGESSDNSVQDRSCKVASVDSEVVTPVQPAAEKTAEIGHETGVTCPNPATKPRANKRTTKRKSR